MWIWKKFTPPKSIFCIFVVYGNDAVETGLYDLNIFINKIFPESKTSILIVNNNLNTELYQSSKPNLFSIYGNNTFREFSGLNKGVQWFFQNKNIPEDAAFILLNDTFNSHYGKKYLELFQKQKVYKSLKTNSIIGWKDSYPETVELFHLQIKSWIRSSFFVLNKNTLEFLFPIYLPNNFSKIFSNKDSFFSELNIISDNYKTFLKTWLFQEKNYKNSFNEHWHSSSSLTKKNNELFKGKAISILHEHYLSALALKNNISIVGIQ